MSNYVPLNAAMISSFGNPGGATGVKIAGVSANALGLENFAGITNLGHLARLNAGIEQSSHLSR